MMKPNVSWIAEYSDGKQLRESQIKYHDLDRTLLSKFSVVDDVGQIVASVKLSKDDQLFYRRRTFAVGTPLQHSIIIFGRRRKNSNQIIIINSDGSVSEDNQFRNKWYEPEWLPQEQIKNGK